MDSTKFNNLYKEFLEYLEKTFPKYKKYVDQIKEEEYLHDFKKLILPYIEPISQRNGDIFRVMHIDFELIRGLKFRRILDKVDNKKVSHKVLEMIWQYLHKLYIVSYNNTELKNYIKKKYDHNILMENITLGSVIIESESSESESESESEESDEEEQLRKDFEKEYKKKHNEGEKEKEEKEEEENKEEEKKEEVKTEDFLQGTMIGKLADELSKEFNQDDFGEIKSPEDLMNVFLNPNGGGMEKMSNVMNKVVGSLTTKMNNGEINRNELLNEAQTLFKNSDLMKEFGNIDIGSMMGHGGKKKNKKKHHHRRH